MKRIVSSVAAVAASLWLTSAGALGLGEIEVRSHLNQRFDAVIPLTSISSEEAADLRVALAGADDFARAGLERADYLSSLHFAVRTDGTPRIEVSSDKLEREPFVQLLLEVHGGGNRILRQYTVLLDPVGLAQQPQPAPVAAPREVAEQPVFEEVQHPAPPPDERPVAPRAEPARPVAEAPVAAAETPAADAPAADAGEMAAAPVSGELYGPVKSAETLWSIATRVRGDSDVTMDQALLALYNSNPRAFDGNINGLNRGAMLRIPTADDMRALDPVEAHREVARLRGLPVGAASDSTPRRHRPVIEPAKIAPPPPASTDATASAAPPPPVSASDTTVAAPAPAAPATDGATAAGTPSETTAADTAQPNGDAAPAADTGNASADNGESAATGDAGAAAIEEPAPAAEPRPAPKAHAESGLLGTLLIPLIVGLLLLLALAWLFTRWRARRTPPAPPPAVTPRRMPLSTPSASEQAVAAAAAGGAAGAAAAAPSKPQKLSPQEELDRLQASLAEGTRDDLPTQRLPTLQLDTGTAEQPTSPAAGLPPVDFDLTGQFATQTVQIDLDANDPVSEADFHLAYGLYDEAALLLRQAAEKDPTRTDIGVKLAETYFAAGKAAEFERTAAELKPKLGAAEWQKLAIMGQQLDPDAVLFKDAAPASPASAPAADTTLDFNFDAEPPPPAPKSEPAMTMQADNGLDFKLDDLELPSLDLAKGDSAAPASPAAADENALDFDLGSFDTPAEARADTPAAPAAEPHDSSASLDFDLGDFDAAPVPAATPEPAEKPVAADTPIEEFDFDAVSADAGDVAGDEASTKLDLARAYVEMGDHDMARSLLDEVLAQGNEQQKQDARSLVERLA